MIRKFNLKMFDRVIADLAHNENGRQAMEPKEVFEGNLIGEFLFEKTGCDKDLMGNYFGQNKATNIHAFSAFLRKFKFKNMSVEACWRLIFIKTGLPKEGQQICRMIECF